MRLLVVSTWYPWPPDNGAKLRAFNLIKELARSHRVTLLTFGEDAPIDDERSGALAALCDSVHVVPRGAFHTGPLTIRGLWSPVPRSYVQGYSPEMAAAVEQSAPGHDAAVALQVTAGLYFLSAVPIPVILEEAEVAVIRDQARAAHGVARVRRGLTWWKYARFVRALTRRAAFTTVVSEPERDILKGAGCDVTRVAVVPNGVDAEDLEWPKPATAADRLIYPGALTYSANLDAVTWFVTDVLPLVRQARPATELWVTGRVNAAAHWLPARGAPITLTGHLQDVRPAIAGSAVCVVPLRIGGGTRLKILQAMALGTPVVSTSKGAEGLDVTDGRDILIGDTPGEFASHVLSLLADPARGERLATAARELVRAKYTWARSGTMLDAIVRSVCPADKAVNR